MPLMAKQKFTRRLGGGRQQIVRDTYSTKSRSWYDVIKQVQGQDNKRCQACGKTEQQAKDAYNGKGLETHHLTPLSRGGRTTGKNLATLCYGCHKKRHKHMNRGG